MPDEKTFDRLETEALANRDDAQRRLELARKQWLDEGEPLTMTHANGIEFEHPLHKLIRDLEKLVSDLTKNMPKQPGMPGRRPTAVPKPTISESPASKRRRLKAV